MAACHAHVLIPGREGEYSATRGCSDGLCMPLHPLQVFVGLPIHREARITLLNPHGDDEEDCDDREDGERHVTYCSYPVVRGYSVTYYFTITVSPARDVSNATCFADPARMLVHRLDRYVRFAIERVQLPDNGACVYVARERSE